MRHIDELRNNVCSSTDRPDVYPLELGCSRRAVASRLFSYSLLHAPCSPPLCSKPSKTVSVPRSKRSAGRASSRESNMRDGLKLVEKSLLEADVSFPVVRDFMSHVTEQAVGEKVLKSLNPSQQVVGIVYQELVNLMGPVDHSLHLQGRERCDRADDVRPARLRQNDDDRQARPDAQAARPAAAARGVRLAAPGGHRPVARAGRAARDSGLLGSHEQGSGRRCQRGRARGEEAQRRCRDSRHGRPAAHRRRADGAARADRSAGRCRSRCTWSSTA